MDSQCSALEGYVEQAAFAAELKVSARTIARYRCLPNGLPFLEIGGKIYIRRAAAAAWLLSREKTPNPRRRAA